MNVLKLDTDKGVHEAGGEECRACSADYPQAHPCGGLVHGEHRYDMEAGFMWTYLYTRCDGCDHEASEEVKPTQAQGAGR